MFPQLMRTFPDNSLCAGKHHPQSITKKAALPVIVSENFSSVADAGEGVLHGASGRPTEVLPTFVPAGWRHRLLHNPTSVVWKTALFFRPGVVVTSVPRHLR
jgi:hypothetical protein